MVQEAGEYQLSYNIYLTADVFVSSRIQVNGTPNNDSVNTPSAPTDYLDGTATVTLAAGDELYLQLHGLLGAVTLDSSNPTVLTIEKLD